MFSLTRNRVYIVLSILFSIFSLIVPTPALHIEDCKKDWATTILDRDPQRTLRYNGRIDAELAWNKTYGVALVKRVTFSGMFQYQTKPIRHFSLDISSLKAIRIQRLIEYTRQGFEDMVKSQCSLGFIYDVNKSLDIPYALEDGIISHAEKCIEDKICDFDPESHRIGDDIHIKSISRREMYKTTSQGTVNAATDLVVNRLISDLVKANKSLLTVPPFDVSVFPVHFSSSGGAVDILKYIKREEDMSFEYEGHRYFIDTVFSLTGGHTELNNVSMTSSLGNFINGKLPVNMTAATFRMKVVFDYNQIPCKISATDATLNIPSDQVDFSPLKIKFLGFEVTNVDIILKTLLVKSVTINAIGSKIADLLKDLVEEQKCEDYRDLLFKLERKA